MHVTCAGLQHRTAVACTSPPPRLNRCHVILIACSNSPHHSSRFNQAFQRCSLSLQQLLAATGALQHRHRGLTNKRAWQQSLGIGAGLGAAACSGAGGADGPPGNSGGGSGGDGSGWGQSPGGSSSFGSNVLADVAAAGEGADAAVTVEEVILLDVGGGCTFCNITTRCAVLGRQQTPKCAHVHVG